MIKIKSFKIKLYSVEEMIEFVRAVTFYDCNIDIKKGSIVLDAKSILAVKSIDTTNNTEIVIHSDDEQLIKEIETDLKCYIVPEV